MKQRLTIGLSTTKKCVKYGSPNLVLIRTQQLKMCNCGHSMQWNLDKNQKPVGY